MSDNLQEPVMEESPKRAKGYKSKPVLIEVFALIYLLNPIGNFLFQLFCSGSSPAVGLSKLFNAIGSGKVVVIINVILWVSAIPLAYGLFKVHLWAWYYFLVHSISMVVISLFNGAGKFDPSVATLVDILFLIPIGYFISKEIRTPYFNPDVRWWEQSRRYHQVVSIAIEDQKFDTYDFSETGAFLISDKDKQYQKEELLPMTMTIGEKTISCFAEIIWHKTVSDEKHPAGYGIRFDKMSFADKQDVKRYIKSLQSMGKQEVR